MVDDMNRTTLRAMLIRHECRNGTPELKPYTDTAGKLTIGVGRNLTDDGISREEAIAMCDRDITEVWQELTSQVQCFGSLDNARQHVLVDMGFNMGWPRLRLFTKMLAAIEARDFDKAADEMLKSLWAKQVGDRATELAEMMRIGA
jgi:lysozyme